MHWKYKAFIQNLVASLPEQLALSVYYPIQRRFGGLRRIDPTKRLQAAIETWDRIVATGRNPKGGVFFEVGTGRMVSVPIAYWLMGAKKTITVDLNRYLKHELILESLDYIRTNRSQMEQLFAERLIPDRFDFLCELAEAHPSIDTILTSFQVEYASPADAAHTHLASDSIDYHTSYTVLEHIPPQVLADILSEAQRITKPHGLIVHGVDYTDHFSHNDSTIDAINFLQFTTREWDRLAGNRFMYMNRLRHSDYLRTFNKSGLEIVADDPQIDPSLVAKVQQGDAPLAAEFKDRPADDLAATFAWIVASPAQALAKCG
ncbi:hypothetical protein Pan181_15340 [Aeoliella mucimassa]|uniref:Methyltransferase type 11 domain-containing protein n=2 Tax=Aeoliella mucimassa TaxID=2527972 RepID=A0A518AKT5_9BACT|nr:hypothetical protein Pan181_15340 [Aeoliella mucimassa]